MKPSITVTYTWSHPFVDEQGQDKIYLMLDIAGARPEGSQLNAVRQQEDGTPACAEHVMLTLHVSDRASIVQTYGQPSYQHFGEITIMAGTIMEQHMKTVVVEFKLGAHPQGVHPVVLIGTEYKDLQHGEFKYEQQEVCASFTSDPSLLSSYTDDPRMSGIRAAGLNASEIIPRFTSPKA